MGADKMRQTIDRLRPWADERAVELALREWMQTSLTQRDPQTRRRTPLRLGDELERDAAAKIAAELHDIGQWAPSDSDWRCERCDGSRCSPSEHMFGAVGFMLRNIIAGREASNYGDGFEVIIGGPVAKTRRRYARDHGREAVWVWMHDKLQYEMDLVRLVRGGKKIGAARRWLQRHPRPPRKRRAA